MNQWVAVIEWFDPIDNDNIPDERKILGPFETKELAEKFIEEFTRTKQTSYQLEHFEIGWYVDEIIHP